MSHYDGMFNFLVEVNASASKVVFRDDGVQGLGQKV